MDTSTLLGSATAGLFARLVCHPFDTCKAQIQAIQGEHGKLSSYEVGKRVIKGEGISGLYRGIGAAVVGSIPAVCLYLSTYEYTKAKLSNFPATKDSDFIIFLSSGMIAEAVSCVVFVPVDVVKERLQVQFVQQQQMQQMQQPLYRSSIHALKTIAATEGIYQGLYKGFGITLLSFGPFSALYFLLYEKMKKTYFQYQQQTTPSSPPSTVLPFLPSLMLSAAAGSIASVVTNPLDLIKLRIQIQRRVSVSSALDGSSRTTPPTSSVTDMWLRIWRAEGVRGLFRGAGARVLYHAPNTAITMALYETCYQWWVKVLAREPNV